MPEYGAELPFSVHRKPADAEPLIGECGHNETFPGIWGTSQMPQLLPFLPGNLYSHFRP